MSGLTENPTTKLKTFESTPLTVMILPVVNAMSHSSRFKFDNLKKKWAPHDIIKQRMGGGVSQLIFPAVKP